MWKFFGSILSKIQNNLISEPNTFLAFNLSIGHADQGTICWKIMFLVI